MRGVASRSEAGGSLRVLGILALGLLAGCSENDASDDELSPARAAEIARIVPAEEALAGAHISTVDPATMNDAEVRQAVGTGPLCVFRYTSDGGPVLAVDMQPNGVVAGGVVKLNGSLVALNPVPKGSINEQVTGILLNAGSVQITVTPGEEGQANERNDGRQQEASMVFEVGQQLRAGYRGYLDCMPEPPARSPRRF